MQGPPDYVFHFENNPSNPTEIDIYTEVKGECYLQSTDNSHSIVVVSGDQKIKFPFKIPAI